MTTASAGFDADPEGLPNWHELLAAFRGWDAADSSRHPVVQCACGLARLHRKRCTGHRRDVVAQRRTALIGAIDTWAAAHVRRPTQSADSIGTYIDRMAAAAATAATTLRTCAPNGDAVHDAWTALAALATGWADITVVAVCPYSRTTEDLP